jgi:hypothetical protein
LLLPLSQLLVDLQLGLDGFLRLEVVPLDRSRSLVEVVRRLAVDDSRLVQQLDRVTQLMTDGHHQVVSTTTGIDLDVKDAVRSGLGNRQ